MKPWRQGIRQGSEGTSFNRAKLKSAKKKRRYNISPNAGDSLHPSPSSSFNPVLLFGEFSPSLFLSSAAASSLRLGGDGGGGGGGGRRSDREAKHRGSGGVPPRRVSDGGGGGGTFVILLLLLWSVRHLCPGWPERRLIRRRIEGRLWRTRRNSCSTLPANCFTRLAAKD